MKLILLSGGSGKRLWPMSNDARSKQFLKVLRGPQDTNISMLQRVWGQLQDVGLDGSAYVCASKPQWETVLHQIGEVPFIEEPMRRDTFPAIALATLYLLDVETVSTSEVVAVVPVDHFVDDHYFETIAKLEGVLSESGANLALMGVTPSEPTSKFGYISVHPSSDGVRWRQVHRFVEKPPESLAAELIREGALWNCGVFAFRAGYLRSLLELRGLPSTFAEFRDGFETLPMRSFDHEVVESAASVVVIPYTGTWKDLGTWSTLTEEMGHTVAGLGNATACEGTHVINELGIPVVAIGLQRAVVVATPDGILVTDKEMSAHLKDAIKPFANRPMYEERRWGSYRVLDYQKLEDAEVLTKWIEIKPGSNISYQKHFKRTETWTILAGVGEVALDTRIFPIAAGDVVRIYAEQWHAIRAFQELKLVEVQRGSELIEEDILRRYSTWEEVENACSLGRQRSAVWQH
ncbi:MAG: sugar phosphate nucleotidyltransferase [Alicyclobacillaceae bacterium]|nr:sugar phosphate nucleotidyltransferase [Alicyclobacillaceae bacterium]